jgi:predicted permease
MGFIGEWVRRFKYLIHRRRIESDLEREMKAHREMMDDPQRFGNVLRLREEARDVWGWNWLDAMWRDLTYAMRSLRRSPFFALTAVLILSLGIGVNLAFFQIVNLTLLRPLDVRDPDTLVRFDRMWRDAGVSSISSTIPYPATEFLRENTNALSAVLTQTQSEMVWGDDATDRVRGSLVSANWFDELGYKAAYGRVFHRDPDESPGSGPVAVLGEEFWNTRLGGDPSVIGSTVRINNRAATVVGIAPRALRGLRLMQQDVAVWVPIHQIDYFAPGTHFKTSWSGGGPELYGRIRAGFSVAAAKESLRASMSELAAKQPSDFHRGEWLEPYSGSLYFERSDEHQLRRGVMLLVAALFILVLLIACANLSSIVLSRNINKVRELSVRTALGASAWRIVTNLLAETTVVAVIGTLMGSVFGYGALKLFAFHIESSWLQWTPDWNTAFASFVIALFAMAAVGFIPSWKIVRKRQELSAAIKDGGQQTSAALGRTRLRQVLIAIQVAGSCVLLVVAGVMVRHLGRVISNPGFDFGNVAVLRVYLDRFGIKGEEAWSYWADVQTAIASIPEVESVSLVDSPPLGNNLTTSDFQDARGLEVTIEHIGPEFFQVMRIPIIAGRPFGAGDDFRRSIIISKRLALKMYGTIDIVGKGFPKSNPERTIVGVASDARLIRLERLNDAEAYFALDPEGLAGLSLIARSRSSLQTLLPMMRQIARTANSRILPDSHSMLRDFESRTDAHRTISLIAVSLAWLALALACLGIFGLLSYAVSLRQKEIGMRMALGATRRSIAILVISQLLWPSLVGIACGVGAGAFISTVIETQSRFLEHADGLVIIAVVLVFLSAASLASLLPAVRATRIDVLHALRYE